MHEEFGRVSVIKYYVVVFFFFLKYFCVLALTSGS
jgi:hypothetical protein